METLKINILNPKAKKLLSDMADLELISIEENGEDSFLEIVNELRSKGDNLSLNKITEEVEAVRKERHEDFVN